MCRFEESGGALRCRRDRIVESENQGATHADRGPDDAGTEKQGRPDFSKVVELHNTIERSFGVE